MQKNTYKIFLFHGVIKKNNYKIRNYNNKHILESNFFKFLKFLKRKGNFLSVDEICYHVINKINLPKNTFCITFDDGFENNFSVAAPILDDLKIPSTFYFSTDFIDKNSMSWIDKLEYCIEKKDRGEVNLPWLKKNFYFSNKKSKILLLNSIRKNVKKKLSIDIDKFTHSILKQLNKKVSKNLNTPIDKKITWNKVKLLNNNNLFTIGGHSHRHISLGSLSSNQADHEISKSFSLFKKKAGIVLKHYSYPEGMKIDYNNSIIKKLKNRGIKCCPTAINGINNLKTDLFKLKRIMIN